MNSRDSLKKKIVALDQTLQQAFSAVDSLASLEEVRLAHLSRHGSIAQLMQEITALSVEDKREIGPLINALKKTAQDLYNTHKLRLEQSEQSAHFAAFKSFDVTAYKPQQAQGSLHIFTKIVEEIENIFLSMGFNPISGPEVETDYHNFEALNIPANHPARALHDTFWLTTPGLLLRTHTSTMQIHAMEKQRPPLAIFAPGRCFRNEATDATHNFMFMQYECLLIDKNISVAQSDCHRANLLTIII